MAKKVESKKGRSKKNNSNTTIIIIIAAFAVVVVGMIAITQLNSAAKIIVPEPVTRPQENGMSIGDPNAPVKVIEFADFKCPVCVQYALQLEPSIIQNYVETGKVYYTVSPFSFIAQESFQTAEAAYCANDQGKFWTYRDYLLANYTAESANDYPDDRLIAFAKKLGLEMNTFETCFTDNQHEQTVLDANTFAKEQGISGTPSFQVNGTLVYADTLVETIEAALAAAK